MRLPYRRLATAAVIALGLAALPLSAPELAASSPPDGHDRPFGDARVLAHVPTPPGFPEGILVRGNRVYVAGPATFGTTGKPPSRVVGFDLDDGRVIASFETRGEDLQREHANSSIALDGLGRLYVLNTQLGIYRLSLGNGAQEPYSSPFPDVPPCSPVTTGPCSPTPHDAPPIPNDLVFDESGDLYVTDSMQATIWRVPARPDPGTLERRPQVWFQDARLASEYIGVNGLRLAPEGDRLYLTVSTDLSGRSFVYTLPLTGAPASRPSADQLQPFFEYAPGELPDGIAFGRSGALYVALANPRVSGVSILEPLPSAAGSPRGQERVRLGNPATSPVHPYDSPANIAFTADGSIVLTNHAIASGVVAPQQFTVLDVFVADKGAPLFTPSPP